MSVLFETKPEGYEIKDYTQVGKGNIYTKVSYLLTLENSPRSEYFHLYKNMLLESLKSFDCDSIHIKRRDEKIELDLVFKASGLWHGKEYAGDYYTPSDFDEELIFVEGKIFAQTEEEYSKFRKEIDEIIHGYIPFKKIEISDIETDFDSSELDWDYSEEVKKTFEEIENDF